MAAVPLQMQCSDQGINHARQAFSCTMSDVPALADDSGTADTTSQSPVVMVLSKEHFKQCLIRYGKVPTIFWILMNTT